MLRRDYIGWVRDAKSIIKHRPVKTIANAITTFSGQGVTGVDGLGNTVPHIVYTFT